MKAVLGILFLLVGLTVAYLVLTGQLPTSSPSALLDQSTTSTTPSGTHTHTTGADQWPVGLLQPPPGGGTGGVHADGPNPMGLPTMLYMSDLIGSQGGMQQ